MWWRAPARGGGGAVGEDGAGVGGRGGFGSTALMLWCVPPSVHADQSSAAGESGSAGLPAPLEAVGV